MPLPGFNDAPAQQFYYLPLFCLAYNPVDSATNYFAQVPATPSTSSSIYVIGFKYSGHIRAASVVAIIGGIPASPETGEMYIRINNTTDYTISTTVDWTAARSWDLPDDSSIPVNAGDTCNIKVVCPAWLTNPTAVIYYGGLWMGP